MTGTAYRYDSLDPEVSQFRLLTILPGNWNEDIRCTLKTWSWDSRPPYEALSYVWGDGSDRRQIWLDNTPFSVTANLEQALRYLRMPNPRTMWIDAVCVNQEDIPERSSQVQMMRRTYQKAANVVMWLGIEEPDTKFAFHLVRIADRLETGPNAPQGAQMAYAIVEAVEREPTGDRGIASLYFDVMTRPYWQRAWIIQEIGVAVQSTVQCGRITMEWPNFADGAHVIMRNTIQPPDLDKSLAPLGMACLSNALGIYSKFHLKKEQRITSLVANSRASSATDPRDCIFALVGLGTGLSHLLVPDYSPSVSAREVYIKFVEHSITEESSLDIVSLSQGRENKLGLPTWVPDWSAPWDQTPSPSGSPMPLLYKFHQQTHIVDEWHAHGNSLPDVSIERLSGTLACRGIAIDAITDVSPQALFQEDGYRPWINLIQRRLATTAVTNPAEPNIFSINPQFDGLFYPQFSLARRNNPRPQQGTLHGLYGSNYRNNQCNSGQYLTGEPLVEACVRTISTDRVSNGRRITPAIYWRFWTDPINPVTQNPLTDPDSRLDISHSMAMRSMNRHLFISQYGYMGLGGTNVRQGDFICIIFGCSVPVVLRHQGDHFLFVCEAYVHGIMDGQAIQQLNAGRLQARGFNIR